MIEVEGLTKQYGTITAVKDVSLRVEKGEVFGLLGPNGAGKTTLIKTLTALSRPDEGRASIGGFDTVEYSLEIKKLVGVVPQENNLDRELTASENLRLYGMLHRVASLEGRMRAVLDMVGLWERRDSVVSHFSGGMQRRLLVARALLSEPEILFLDEPSTGLDPQIRRSLWDIIRKAGRGGRTVVITTHYIEEAEALCGRVGILSKGRLIALDRPDILKARAGEYVVEFIDSEGRLLQEMFRSREEAHERARGIESPVTVRRTNLEDVFIKLTGERIE
ncbi:MAG TPA: ABC transporter ATP-binding protein [Nitrospirota bacterium]|nr:ABC transporter ATP-binding protein [Nitrospirota bacterium]